MAPTDTPEAEELVTATGRWTLTWSDTFNGPDGSSVDPAKWNLETGGGGWGNGELQYYTARTDNVYLENKRLVIKAQRESYRGHAYTSARMTTKDKFSQRYGRFEARLQLPYGQGIWPAFWMLGDNLRRAGWPGAGEIDIMEYIGKTPDSTYGSLHGPGYSGGNSLTDRFRLPDGQSFSSEFHDFACEWEPEEIRWYVDDQLYHTVTPADVPDGGKWVFDDQPFFMILNLAVGGAWPGYPDGSTEFPQYYYVEYVRVYERAP